MAIKDLGGRLQSEQTPQELAKMLKKEFASLSPQEQEAVRLCLREMDDPAFRELAEAGETPPTRIYDVLQDSEYKRQPVDIETFVKDPYYLGATCDVLYPKLLEDMKELFSGNYREAVLSGSIGWGKSLTGDTVTVDGITGRRMTVKEAVGRDILVPSLDGVEIKHRPPSRIWKCGHKQCFRMTLASGQHIGASKDHPVLTPAGYVPILDLKPGDLVATARSVPCPENVLEITDAEVITAAYLIADGSTAYSNRQYCKGNRKLVDEFILTVSQVPGFDSISSEKFERGAWYVGVKGIQPWTDRYGINCLSRDKRVPASFFGLSNRQLALFLNRVLTDGSVYTGSPRKIELTLASEGLIDDVQYLLRRFGIVARKSYKQKSIKQADGSKKYYDAWRLQIADALMQIRFLEFIGPIFGNEDQCAELLRQAQLVKSNPNWDIAPITTEELKEIRKETGPHTNAEWKSAGGALAEGSRLGREKFRRLCRNVGYEGKYRKFAEMDVVWERISSIEDIGWHDVYDLTVPETENVVANGIIVHNTFFASIAVCRIIYELSCMKDPHRSFGIGQGTNIAFVALSVSEPLAIKVVFENIANKIEASPYFHENFECKPTKRELTFPGNIWVAARASTDSAALGLNVFGCVIDESNFLAPMKKKNTANKADVENRAEFLYSQLLRRMKSRFQRHGKLPGMMIIVSSKKTHEDFTAKRVNQSKDDPTVFVRDYAVWHVKEGVFSEKKFHVLVGNDTTPSKILEPDEVELVKGKLQDGMVVIEVPDDFRRDFDEDLDGSIRDIAGCATVSISPFIQQRDRIVKCIDETRTHPFSTEEWVQTEGGGINWTKLAHQIEIRDGAEKIVTWQPKHHPGLARHVHIDPSLNTDSTGIAVGCVLGYKQIRRRDKETQEEYTEPAPIIWIDFVLRVNPPVGGEIDQGMIRGIVYQFQKHGFHIGLITMDQYNSASSLQKFQAKGMTAERMSVDKPMDAYDTLKSAIYEERIFVYEYEPLLRELRALQKDNIKNKVDHPQGGTKDCADALCGIVYTLSTRYHGPPMGIVKGLSRTSDPATAEQTEMVDSDDFMLPFLQG